jgi:hypothetical protein
MSKFVDMVVFRTETRQIVVSVNVGDKSLGQSALENDAIELAQNSSPDDFELVNVDYEASLA